MPSASGVPNEFWSDSSLWTSPGFAGTTHNTYYAFVSPGAVSKYQLSLPKGPTSGSYGQEWCGAFTSGAHNGWDCDATHWYLDTAGKDASPHSPYLGHDGSGAPCTPSTTGSDNGDASRGCVSIAAYPGSPFSLRDVDCTDNSIDPVRTAVKPIGDPTGQVGTLNGCEVIPS